MVQLNTVLERVAAVGSQVIGARYAAVALLSQSGTRLESFTTVGISAEERAAMPHLPEGHGILGGLIRDPRPLRLPDLSRHPDSAGFPPGHPPMKSFLGVPILGSHGVLGELYLTDKIDAEQFSEEDEHLAILLAMQIAGAVENVKLHQESARLLAEVQQLHRTRERFFAMVNHELRNALAAVIGWAEMLTRKKDPAQVPRAAFEVLDAAEGASALINDLLDLSRLDEDRLKPANRTVDCVGIVKASIARVEPQATARKVTVEAMIAESPLTCWTDSQRVEQILINLLGNAIRHTPSGSRVVVKAATSDSMARLTIEDEGPGIPPDQVERIFDVYETKAGEESRGTGLGLPLSRRLARLLGGDLVAHSQPGGGGFFTLTLPQTPIES